MEQTHFEQLTKLVTEILSSPKSQKLRADAKAFLREINNNIESELHIIRDLDWLREKRNRRCNELCSLRDLLTAMDWTEPQKLPEILEEDGIERMLTDLNKEEEERLERKK